MKRTLLAFLCVGLLVACSDDKAKPATPASSSAPAPGSLDTRFTDEPVTQGFTRQTAAPVVLGLDNAASTRAGNDVQVAALQSNALSAGGFVDARLVEWRNDTISARLTVTVVQLESPQDATGLVEFDRITGTNTGVAFDIAGMDDEASFTIGDTVHVSFARDDRVWSLLFTISVPDHSVIDPIVRAQADVG